ncbi:MULTISPECIES: carbon-nitrogen hydrolase family protein [unclassified Polaromonas]|uniref:carbon-nitrogen hydrolase family protein n=1 Tax=unclassified Polaromonas TaxID=2638319 RepID=UPI0018C91CB6|nr:MULTISPECIES: carbon-nitrogen hydrolase family protein [unclassified Polaromonas]MBG6115500.1 nitrilase [Polaromonas sp. CG_9.2]MDH6183310.1 nitrilase [Polaromonas sp. CG_23.6]
MKIAAIQMVSGTGVQANLDAAHRLLAQAAGQGAELAVLPEYFCIMGLQDTDKLKVREHAGSGLIQDFLSRSARELDMWIVGGTLPTATGDAGRARNSSLVYAPSGTCVARYDKIHLFRFDHGGEAHDETRVLDPGNQPVRFELASRDGHIYTVGLSVCYDLRFPELYRALKADVLLVPSAFTWITGQAHWELLLRARAIENLAYVVAAAQGGVHENGRRTWGHSMVVGPWGEILAVQAEGPGVVMSEVQASRLQEVRQRLPALNHRVL